MMIKNSSFPLFLLYAKILEQLGIPSHIIDSKGNVKTKTVKEIHLIDAVNPTDCEKKLAEAMAGTMYEWKPISVVQSKIQFVY